MAVARLSISIGGRVGSLMPSSTTSLLFSSTRNPKNQVKPRTKSQLRRQSSLFLSHGTVGRQLFHRQAVDMLVFLALCNEFFQRREGIGPRWSDRQAGRHTRAGALPICDFGRPLGLGPVIDVPVSLPDLEFLAAVLVEPDFQHQLRLILVIGGRSGQEHFPIGERAVRRAHAVVQRRVSLVVQADGGWTASSGGSILGGLGRAPRARNKSTIASDLCMKERIGLPPRGKSYSQVRVPGRLKLVARFAVLHTEAGELPVAGQLAGKHDDYGIERRHSLSARMLATSAGGAATRCNVPRSMPIRMATPLVAGVLARPSS